MASDSTPLAPLIAVDSIKQRLQSFFTDGLVIVVGAGLSAAEGISGMPALASHLRTVIPAKVKSSDEPIWKVIEASLDEGKGLEATLLLTPPSPALESLIVEETATFLQAEEAKVFLDVLENKRILRSLRANIAETLRRP